MKLLWASAVTPHTQYQPEWSHIAFHWKDDDDFDKLSSQHESYPRASSMEASAIYTIIS